MSSTINNWTPSIAEGCDFDPIIIARFLAKVDTSGECWNWTASKRNKGYGAFTYNHDGKLIQGRAHRFSYELTTGRIPAGLFVCHKCDNPACVRPDHLFLGTNADNVHDMIAKGRQGIPGTFSSNYLRGEMHHAAVLSEQTVRVIRLLKADGKSYSVLSKQFGIAIGHLHRIVSRKAWKHVI